MDIHKPKPWRGSREFVKEIGTIVIGVLIALAGEQAVEWIHRGQEVAEAREALRTELALNATLMRLSLEASPCFQRRLDGVAAWARGGPAPIWSPGALDTLKSSAWDEAKVAAVAHMPLKERIGYDRFYASAADRADVIRAERGSMVVMAGFTAEPQVAPDDRRAALQGVARIKAQQGILANYDRLMLDELKSMSVSPGPLDAKMTAGLAKMCKP
jgi:hypothetical protein